MCCCPYSSQQKAIVAHKMHLEFTCNSSSSSALNFLPKIPHRGQPCHKRTVNTFFFTFSYFVPVPNNNNGKKLICSFRWKFPKCVKSLSNISILVNWCSIKGLKILLTCALCLFDHSFSGSCWVSSRAYLSLPGTKMLCCSLEFIGSVII
jgi:hypothetical protein